MSHRANESGFSLVEALVALAVFAMAGVALVQLQSQSLHTFSRVEARALADLAAQNRLTEVLASRGRPAAGASEEVVTFAGREWAVQVSVTAVPGGALQRVSVAVGAPGASPLTTVHGFLPAPEGAL